MHERKGGGVKYDLTLRGFLSRIQANARRRAVLVGEYVLHSDNPEHKAPKTNDELERLWDNLRRDLKKVLGVDLCPWGRLISDPDFDMNAGWTRGAPDPYRIRMGVLKAKADRARLKDPSITLLKGAVFERGSDAGGDEE